MELQTSLIKYIRKAREEAWYCRCQGEYREAQIHEDHAAALERILWNCKIDVPVRKQDVRGHGWRTRAYNMFGVFMNALQS